MTRVRGNGVFWPTLLVGCLLAQTLSAEDDRIAEKTGGAIGAPETGAIAQGLGVTADVAEFLAKNPSQYGYRTRMVPPKTLLNVSQNAAGVLGVCQFAVNVYQNKGVQWSDAAGLAATLGSWAGTIPAPYGSLAQMLIVTAQSVQARAEAEWDLNYEIATDYYRGAGGAFRSAHDPGVTQGGALADQFIAFQLDRATRQADFSSGFHEYCRRRYKNYSSLGLIERIGTNRRLGAADPIPAELRGLARRFLDDQMTVFHLNNELTRMRAFVAQNMSQIRALAQLAQTLRDDPTFIERYRQFYREHYGTDEEEEGGPNKAFRVLLRSAYDDRALPFRGITLTSTEATLNTNEEGLTPYTTVDSRQESINIVVTAKQHKGFSGALPLGSGSQQTVEVKLEPEDVKYLVTVISEGRPIDAMVQLLGPAGRLQAGAASAGTAYFTLRPGTWIAQVTSPGYADVRRQVSVPLPNPDAEGEVTAGSVTIEMDRVPEGAVRDGIAAIEAQQKACELEDARTIADDLDARFANDPAWRPWAAAHRAQITREAGAQKEARRYLRLGKAAIHDKNLDGAIAHLRSALALPELPECMRQQMMDLLKELEDRKGQTPTPPPPPGSYRLVRVKAKNSYPGHWKADSGMMDPGEKVYGPGQKSFKMGWQFTFGADGRGFALANVTVDVPATVAPGQPVNVSGTADAKWDNHGYAVDRVRTIRLNVAGEEKFERPPGPPSGSYSASVRVARQTTVYEYEGKAYLSASAYIDFGPEHTCWMSLSFEYEK
jgi:hypothetical protein